MVKYGPYRVTVLKPEELGPREPEGTSPGDATEHVTKGVPKI